jgi:general stress protein YciG
MNPTEEQQPEKKSKFANRGFASMDSAKHKEIARLGGKKVSQNREHMAAIGKKGGAKSGESRAHMAEIGRKGGLTVSQDREHMANIGRKGGESKGKKE